MTHLPSVYSLTAAQEEYREHVYSYSLQKIKPYAKEFDEHGLIPMEFFQALGREGYMGANVNEEYGGKFVDNIQIGLLHEAIGAACSSVRSILTVHGMVCEAIQRWGTAQQRMAWLPLLATGQKIAAFALTELHAGSDAKGIKTVAEKRATSYVLSGEKCWISAGRIADVFLIFAKCDGKDIAVLLDRNTPGLSVVPTEGMLGLRGSMLAFLKLDGCEVPFNNRIGGLGFGIDAVGGTALDFGRYTVAWGCIGIGQDCLDSSIRFASTRQQFGKYLREHQLVSALLTDMIVGVRAAGLICARAGTLRDQNDSRALLETCVAKYMASRMCAEVSSNTVQIHGAVGCCMGHAAQRHYRDAKIMELIEGSTQIQQTLIAKLSYDAIENGYL